jgi:lipopolysaccharide/colanic/teichoic acid biosynthesis glycosyltransferase
MTGSTSIGKTSIKAVNTKEKSSVDLRAYISQRQSYLLGKRIFDIAISALVLVFIFSWLFPILFLLIKLDSNGPVFFV